MSSSGVSLGGEVPSLVLFESLLSPLLKPHECGLGGHVLIPTPKAAGYTPCALGVRSMEERFYEPLPKLLAKFPLLPRR